MYLWYEPNTKTVLNKIKKDYGPKRESRYDFAIYYIVYTIVFPFFFVNVFIAFVILTFQGEGDAQLELECSLGWFSVSSNYYGFCHFLFHLKTEILKTLKEKNDQICLEYAINSKPINKYMPKDKSCFQYKIWKIITSTYFDNFILRIVLNFVKWGTSS